MQKQALEVPDVEIHVSRVQVAGLIRTKNDIVVEHIKDVLQASSLKELFVKALTSMEQLQDMKVFKNVSLKIDTDKRAGLEREGVEVTFLVQELGWLKAMLGAHAGTQSGDASLSLALRNIFGRAEQLEVTSGTSFPLWGHNVQLQFTKPYYKNFDKKLLLSLGTTDTKLPMCGYDELLRSGSVELQTPSWLGSHKLSWEVDWREITGFSYNAPLSVRANAGHSLKSSLKHTLVTDERDDPLLPHSGYQVKMTHEMAGLGGDTVYGKAEVQSELYQELWRDWVLSLRVWGGLMRPFTQSKINDRFLLGGATSLRGFGLWGAGPRDQGYSLGGEAYWATGLHLFSPLPFTRNQFLQRIRVHTFATAGNLIQCRTVPSPRDLASGTRVSCGVGLHFRLGLAQIELNYAIPIRAQATDQIQPGLQFGIGLDML
ncbi:sorting and assembly machinery component 50 homolog A-like [Halichondria panicea]|uniref:sorting and assembly machinery component 50 homolog A-like n=1 Tax=Halichondria panicea TaxID=6063 RepID=UPI00312B662C